MYVFDHHVGNMETPSVVQFGAQYTMDNEFLCIGFNLLSANTNLSSARQHIQRTFDFETMVFFWVFERRICGAR